MEERYCINHEKPPSPFCKILDDDSTQVLCQGDNEDNPCYEYPEGEKKPKYKKGDIVYFRGYIPYLIIYVHMREHHRLAIDIVEYKCIDLFDGDDSHPRTIFEESLDPKRILSLRYEFEDRYIKYLRRGIRRRKAWRIFKKYDKRRKMVIGLMSKGMSFNNAMEKATLKIWPKKTKVYDRSG